MEDGVSLESLRAAAQDDVRALRDEITTLSDAQIGLILTKARSHYAWTDKPVSDDMLHKIFDIMKMGPTSMNTCPSRIIFVRSEAGKERLAKSLKPANVPKVMNAPVTAIIAYDVNFWEELPKLFPHEDRRPHFKDKPAHAKDTAYRIQPCRGLTS